VSESSLSAKRESVPATLATVADARDAMLTGIAMSPEEFVRLGEALGRILAQPVMAKRDQPPFPVSEMDGYAVIAAGTPASLKLIGESSAGHGFAGRLAPDSTIRISTGAAVPEGADAVVIQENVSRVGNMVDVPRAEKGQHIRPQAMDFTAGTTLLPAGRRLDGIALALASASGMAKLAVRRRPRVAILSGGDELAEPGSEPGPFQIFDSGTHGIAALVTGWGGIPNRLQLEKDDAAAIARAAEKGLTENDLLVLVGGASVGDHDHARPALQKLGLAMIVNKVNLRPGKPTWFGHALQRPVLGLPGNPASALVCAHLFLRPLLEAMLGRDASVTFRRARLLEALPANGHREHYLRAHLATDAQGTLTVHAFERQDSSLLSVFAAANALIRLPAGAAALSQGALVDVLPLGSF
jgi:molybdopterin molybdotransferase